MWFVLVCWLEIGHCLVTLSCLMCIVLFLPMQSLLTSFWRSFTGLVQLSCTAFTCLPSYRYSRAYLCWRHTHCQWPIIELTKNVSPKNKMATRHVSRFIRMRVFRGVKNGRLIMYWCSRTNRKRSSFATKHFQRKSLKIFDLHPPLRRLVLFVARIIMWKVRCWVTDT